MTREDMELYLNNEVFGRCDYDIYSTLIDFVQDDSLFFESRTCESCKHSHYWIETDIMECGKLEKPYDWENMKYLNIVEVTKDFSCSKWEQN